jgi:hypothetical protein
VSIRPAPVSLPQAPQFGMSALRHGELIRFCLSLRRSRSADGGPWRPKESRLSEGVLMSAKGALLPLRIAAPLIGKEIC